MENYKIKRLRKKGHSSGEVIKLLILGSNILGRKVTFNMSFERILYY